MKRLSCLSAAILSTVLIMGEASAANIPATKVSHHHHRGGAFSNWCAYNCYSVSRSARAPLGRYAYSQYAYDEDLPFPHRWDIDASPIDNVLGVVQAQVGNPLLRAGERSW